MTDAWSSVGTHCANANKSKNSIANEVSLWGVSLLGLLDDPRTKRMEAASTL